MTQTSAGPFVRFPFFTTKELGAVTGLGLATVYGIVKQHQGWIIVDSQLDAGSMFTIFLPPALKPAAPAAASKTAPPSARESMPRGNETILVVEDEPALRELVVSILQICGYRTYLEVRRVSQR